MRLKKYISFALASILAFSLIGCGGSSAPSSSTAASSAEATLNDISNREDFGTAYTMTAVFCLPKPDIENKEAPSGSITKYPDITDCGELGTFNKKYSIPEITADKDVEYYSPILCDKEIASVKYIEDPETMELYNVPEGEHFKETTLKVGGSDVKGYLLKDIGDYELTIDSEVIKVTVKDSSLYLDTINEIYTPNIMINTSSDDFEERAKEYDITVPALVKSYLEKFKGDEDKTLAALKLDNSLYLKEYNRIRLLRGEKILSAEDMVEAYKDAKVDESKIATAPNRRGFKEKVAILRGMSLTPEEKKGGGSTNSTANTNTKKDTTSSSSAANNDSSKKDDTKKNNTARNTTISSGGNDTGTGSEALALVNEYRAQYGLPPFSWGDGNVASIRAQEIVTNFSHYSASGQQCYGENICMAVNGTARQAVKQWIESPPHRQNLLDPVCTRCAIAVCYSGGYWWWSMNMWK